MAKDITEIVAGLTKGAEHLAELGVAPDEDDDVSIASAVAELVGFFPTADAETLVRIAAYCGYSIARLAREAAVYGGMDATTLVADAATFTFIGAELAKAL